MCDFCRTVPIPSPYRRTITSGMAHSVHLSALVLTYSEERMGISNQVQRQPIDGRAKLLQRTNSLLRVIQRRIDPDIEVISRPRQPVSNRCVAADNEKSNAGVCQPLQ